MRAVQNDKLPALDLLKESSFCLGCRACEPVCPAGVEYGVLLEEMRDITWQGKNRPLIIRGLFAIVDSKLGMWGLGLFSPMAKRRQANKDLHLMYGCFERRLGIMTKSYAYNMKQPSLVWVIIQQTLSQVAH